MCTASLRRRGMSDEEAWQTALSWLGDELAIYDDGAEVVATWRVRFADSLERGHSCATCVNADAREVAWSAVACMRTRCVRLRRRDR